MRKRKENTESILSKMLSVFYFHLYHSTISIINELRKKLLISNIWNIMAFLGLTLDSVCGACACIYTSAGAGAPADKHTPCALLSKTAHATAGATANGNSITDCIRRARRNGWAPLNRLAPHPFFPSCCFFMSQFARIGF